MKTKITNRLALAFISLILISIGASAIENEDGVQIYYRWIGDVTGDKRYEVTNYNKSDEPIVYEEKKYKGEVNIPDEIYNYAKHEPLYVGITKGIGKYAFLECTELTSVTIPNSVEYINEGAFFWCTGLTSITIPNGVTSIGEAAFAGCVNLKSLSIPSSLTYLGKRAFEGCSSISSSIAIPDGIISIGESAFNECKSITSISIPGSLIDIPRQLCSSCHSLSSLSIHQGVQNIGGDAFLDCKALNSVVLPSSIKTIGGWAFGGCENLTSINIPEGVTQIEGGAFYGCDKIQYFYLPSTLTKAESIPSNVTNLDVNTNVELGFKDLRKLTTCNIGNSVTSIADGMFASCSKLTSVSISNSVKSIGNGAFSYCTNLENISIPSSVRSIGENAFIHSNISSISIPSGVERIERQTFYGCSNLSSVTLPNTVTSIGNSAFSYCSNLTSINFLNNVESIEMWAFWGCDKVKDIFIPKSVKNIGQYAFNMASASSIIVDEDNLVYDSRNNCNAIIETATNTLVTGCNGTIIPSSVKKIGEYSFSDCADFTEIEIPNGVESIGEGAFLNCHNLTTISLPNSLKEIGNGAFGNVETATKFYSYIINPYAIYARNIIAQRLDNSTLYVPKGTKAKYKTTEGWKEFKRIVEFDTSLPILPNYDIAKTDDDGKTIYYEIEENNNDVKVTNGDYSGDVVIPKKIRHEDKDYDVKKIGEDAFSGCDEVTTVTLPESINEIGEDAFDDCIGITDIYVYPNTPPTLPDNGFDEATYENAVLHVPENKKEEYENSVGWKNFKYIEEFDASSSSVHGVISKEANVKVIRKYTIDGKQSPVSQKGLGLLKMSNGETRKILE